MTAAEYVAKHDLDPREWLIKVLTDMRDEGDEACIPQNAALCLDILALIPAQTVLSYQAAASVRFEQHGQE